MAKNKQLGIFWGRNSLCFVESMVTTPTQFFEVPFEESQEGYLEDGKYIPAEMQLVTPITNALHHQDISTPTTVNLSLPTNEIIFRTFIIPWMPSGEIKSVVEFEVSKYIPFSLEDLSFSFFPMTISISGAKRIRIIFVAIKKDALERYTDILERADLRVRLVEPAPLSLIRTLSFRGIIPPSQIVAIVEKEKDNGRIIVVDQGIPLFVRDFSLKLPENQPDQSEKALITFLVNEIRISLDYFNRQNNQIRVKKILLISEKESEILAARLKNDLEIDVAPINKQLEMGKKPEDLIDNVNAFGASIYESVYSRTNFNLVGASSSKPQKAASFGAAVKSWNPKVMIPTIISCACIVLASFVLPGIMLKAKLSSIKSFKNELGAQIDIIPQKLEAKNEELQNNLDTIKSIRTISDIAFFLSTIPKLLPEGTWLNKITLDYSVKPVSSNKKIKIRPAIFMDGYAFSEDPQQQFSQVNDFLNNLQNKSDFASFFTSIDIKSVKAETLEGYKVTSFKIDCK